MGLFDTIKGVARKAGAGVRRTVGNIAHGIRHVADLTKPVAIGVGRFVRDNHAPLAMIAKSLGDASGNKYAQAFGNAAMSASGMYATRQRLDAFNAAHRND
jgi:hypothetical protein